MVRRLIWAFFRLVIFLPLWFLGLVVFALGLVLSPWGTGLLLEEGANRGFYELDTSQGAPLDTLVLNDLRFTVGPARVAAQRIELAWGENCLLRGRLCLDGLILEGARIRLGESADAPDEADDAAPAAPLEAISLPFPVEIRSIALLDVEVQLVDGTRLSWDHFTTGAVAQGSTLTLLPTRLAGIRLLLPLSPGSRLALSEADHEGSRLAAQAIDASIAVQSSLPTQAAAELEGLASLPLESQPRRELPEIRLPLRLEVPELLVEDFAVSGAADYGVQRLALSLSGEGHLIEITPLEVATRDVDARLEASVELKDDYPLDVRLEAALLLPEIMPDLAGQRLDLTLAGSLAELSGSLGFRGPVNGTLDVRLDALDPTLPFTAALNSDLIQWPLPGKAPLAEEQEADEADEANEKVVTEPWLVEDIDLRLEGSLLDYRLAASLMVEGPQLPYTRLALTGTGDNQHFAWTPLSVSLGDASVVSRGRVDWSDDLAVEGLLRLDNVNPGDFVDGLQGRLDGDVNLSFAQSPAGWNLRMPDLAIDGELQALPLSLRASVSGDSDMQWTIKQLDFRQAKNRLNASGRVSESRLDVSGELDFPALANLHDELAGSLVGDFRASGSLASPELDLDLSGNGLAFVDNRLERLRLVGSVMGLEDPEMDVRLDIDRLNAAGERFNDIVLVLEGRLSNHRLDLDANAGEGMPLSRASLALEGAMGTEREGYAGRLSSLEVDTDYGDIRLAEPLAFEVDIPAGSARVQPFCLRREQGGSLCLEETLDASAEQGSAVLGIRALPMSLVEDLMPENWDLGGATDAELSAEWRQGGAQWQADLDVRSEIRLAGLDAYGQPWQLPESRLSLEVDANPTRADLDLSLTLAESGRLQLALGIDDPVDVGSLDGRLIIDDLRISRYRTLVAGMDTLEGRIDGDVRIG
ncbi:translocation/assembly module TamB, partial [Halomonas sp.]|uniref:translocation/assembly module TamB n=1 Tax=Halomonas sp. TaxID=1486246 RepID=UPI0035697FB6